MSVAIGFTKLINDYISYNAKVGGTVMHTRSTPSAGWTCPPPYSVNINVDAHVLDGWGIAAGVAIRDDEGKMVLAAVRRCKVEWEVEMAETYAARYGMEIAKRFGFDNIILESGK